MKSAFVRKKKKQQKWTQYSTTTTMDNGATAVTFNDTPYVVPTFTASWSSIPQILNWEKKPMRKATKDAQILGLEYQVRTLEDQLESARRSREQLWQENRELSGPSKNPIVKTLKAIGFIVVSPVLAVGAIILLVVDITATLVNEGAELFDEVF